MQQPFGECLFLFCETDLLIGRLVVQQTSRGTHVGEASSQLQHGGGWSAGIPVLAPLQSQSATPGRGGPRASTSRGSAVSALLTHSAPDTGTTLLVPKTEKLSPIQLYSTDRSSLTGRTSLPRGQTQRQKSCGTESNDVKVSQIRILQYTVHNLIIRFSEWRNLCVCSTALKTGRMMSSESLHGLRNTSTDHGLPCQTHV